MTGIRSGRSGKRTRAERETIVGRAADFEDIGVQHGVSTNAVNWRYVSGLIVVTLSLIVIIILRSDAFIVRAINVSGTTYLNTGEIFRYTDIAEQHILSIDPTAMQAALLDIPTIAEAEVSIGWPPDMVRIRIVERSPALLWNQNGIEAWVDLHGRVLTAPLAERPDLLEIVTRGIETPIGINDSIPQDIVDGARQLQELVLQERRLRYDPFLGLGFRDAGGWEAWFGGGTDMPMKILVYRELVAELAQRGITPSVINVSNPDRPYCSGC